jgi:UDP-N-acetylglucosamine 2-epimerase (non-hydrolysing)
MIPRKKILHVVGARPNFMKIAPLYREMAAQPDVFEQILVHTGQHYDAQMSDVFFRDLEIPEPDVNLAIGSGSHARQTAEVMVRFEPVLEDFRPDWVIVPGDVNSTLACALVAAKLHYRVAHLEAGLRSFDRSMPEEINRLVTDQVSDLLLTPSSDGNENLIREGVDPAKIHMVGNIMIDTLVRLLPKAEDRWQDLGKELKLDSPYVLATLHRPANVDDPNSLREVLLALNELSTTRKVLFPVHPRTRQRITGMAFAPSPGLVLIDPLGYLDFLALERHAALVLTDSGGVQEETTFLGVPCLTARPNTERPVTISLGTNVLVAANQFEIVNAAMAALAKSTVRDGAKRPPLWDGGAAARIVTLLQELP